MNFLNLSVFAYQSLPPIYYFVVVQPIFYYKNIIAVITLLSYNVLPIHTSLKHVYTHNNILLYMTAVFKAVEDRMSAIHHYDIQWSVCVIQSLKFLKMAKSLSVALPQTLSN